MPLLSVTVVSSHDYRRGQWRALNDVLGFLNTLEDQRADKATIYKAVAAMRPGAGDGQPLDREKLLALGYLPAELDAREAELAGDKWSETHASIAHVKMPKEETDAVSNVLAVAVTGAPQRPFTNWHDVSMAIVRAVRGTELADPTRAPRVASTEHWCIFHDGNCPERCATKCFLNSPYPGGR